jgi:hypothetical protein
MGLREVLRRANDYKKFMATPWWHTRCIGAATTGLSYAEVTMDSVRWIPLTESCLPYIPVLEHFDIP